MLFGDALKPEILVVGHKNPDTDSVISAHAYAWLKNHLDPQHRYLAGRCGALTKQTKFIFERLGVTPPPFVPEAYPQVGELMSTSVESLGPEAPLRQAFVALEEARIRQLPVVDANQHLLGVVGMAEISHYLLQGSTAHSPLFRIRPANLPLVMEGKFLQQGQQEEFNAQILVGAMSLEAFSDYITELQAENLLLVVGQRGELIQHALGLQIPALVLTGFSDQAASELDLTGYRGWVFQSRHDSAESMRRALLAVPVSSLMQAEAPSIHAHTALSKAREEMASTGLKSLPVVDEAGQLLGVVSQSDLLKAQARKLILMDHNEMDQAIDGADQAEILEIIDHHRLGTIKTKNPVHFFAKPVGATCTLVYQQYRLNGVELPREIAHLLLSGILTDTVILKSPTTTPEDVQAVAELATGLGVDAKAWGIEIFSSTDSLKARLAQDILHTDFKVFTEAGLKLGIGQVEVVTLEELPEKEKELHQELARTQAAEGLDWTLLLVTDIIKEDSQLLCTPFAAGEERLHYKALCPQKFFLPKVLSRKKQLLPEVLRVAEELAKAEAGT